MESISLFVKRFLAFLAGPVISAGISFLIVPLTTWLVSPAEFGKASMYTLVVSLFSLVVYLGIDQAYVREYNESGDRRGLFMNSLILPLLFSLVVSSVVFLSWKTFSSTLFGKEDFLPAILFVVAFPFTVLERFNLLSIRMEEKARVYSLLTILRQLLRAPLLIFFLYYFRNFHGVIFAEASAQVLLPIFSGYVARKNWSTRFNLDKSLIKTLL
jgi:O-antigen/teichoic acid export membrane protein